ncbi:MAG: 2-hydroxyacyl-CoA dehydratase family protein [Thermodesulfobacteriota bacterium]|nr:2-hydroxyacyl-CoA dehydratase family protein [Thermodesulfobacteriota bacterium]
MSEKRKPRFHATEAAANIPKMVKGFMEEYLHAREEGRLTAYTFICCSYDEILRAMDIVPIWTENFAGVCGAKHDAQRFLERAEGENLSRSLCTYALCAIGFDCWREEIGEMPPDSPWGGMPKPDMMLGSGQLLCDPRNKWYQASQHYMPEVPMYDLGVFWPPYEDDYHHREVETYYIKYNVEQLRGLVRFLESHTGKKMDWDKLEAVVDLTERTWTIIWEAHELRRAVPTPMGTGDAMNTMVPSVFMMGTQAAYTFYKELYEELKRKVEAGLGVIPDEKYRLIWGGGLPPWFALSDFTYFNNKGAVFPVEITYRMTEAIDNLDLPRTSNPLERIAWRNYRFWTYWYDRARKREGSHPDIERIIQYIEDYHIDGIVMHEAFSCRTWHVKLIWQLNQIKKIYREIPSLILESDIVDIRSYSEVDTHNRIDTFIDTLESFKTENVEKNS